MSTFIYSLPSFLLFALINVVFITISVVALAVLKRYSTSEDAYHANEVMGYISATICILYAVLVGFIALYLLDNFSKADESTKFESSRVASIYYDTKLLAEPLRTQIQTDINDYLHTVVNVEWPAMQKGTAIKAEDVSTMSTIINKLQSYRANSNTEFFAMQEAFRDIKALYEAREDRLHMADAALRDDIWFVIFVGAFLTIAVNYTYGMRFALHLESIIATAVIVASSIYLVVALDHPFQGEFCVNADAFHAVMNMIRLDQAQPVISPATAPPLSQ